MQQYEEARIAGPLLFLTGFEQISLFLHHKESYAKESKREANERNARDE